MGKVYLNADNKLVVETDNAKIEGNETTTVLKSDETFDIDVTTVSKLLALFNDVTLCDKKCIVEVIILPLYQKKN